MVLSYKELNKKGYSDYQIKKLLKEEKLFFIKKGMYSTDKTFNYLEYISCKHPNAVITLQSASYCYGLLKKENQIYTVATKQKDRKIIDEKISQTFMTDILYNIGINKITYKGFKIRIYDLERLLIEVARNKVYIDYNDYKQIMFNYKKLKRLINQEKLFMYLKNFKDDRIVDRIKKEVGI